MNADDIRIRDYRDSDFETILEMESSRGGDPYCHAVFIRQMAVLFPGMFLVARKGNGDTTGYVIGGMSADEPKTGLIMRIFVSPAFRRSGIAKSLMKELIKRFSLYGAKSITLTVSPSNKAALGLYESLGFSESLHIEDYFGRSEDRFVMTAPLDETAVESHG